MSIAERERLSKDYLEQLFLKLKRAGIVRSMKGARGGYLLAKDPGDITIKEVIEALEGDIYEVFCSPEIREKIVCTHFDHCGVRPMWMRLKELIDDFFSRVTLKALVRDEGSVMRDMGRIVLSGTGS